MKVTVIGAGAWGTTIAIHLAHKAIDVTLWAYETDLVGRMRRERVNEVYLPGFRFPDALEVTSGFDSLPDCDFIVNAVPTQFIRGVYSQFGSVLPAAPMISLSKGIEIGTGKLPTQVYSEVQGEERETATLTGPCIAREIAQGLPTAVVVAGDRADMYQAAFNTDRFRVYTSEDKLGAELGAALKNVMGLTAGIVDGMKLGDNAKASVLTRGVVEIARLGVALGAELSTFNGLAGFGDLFTTCVSPFGRNRTVGERIGKGESIEEILGSMSSVAEGVPTTRAVLALAREHSVEMPITTAIHGILFEKLPLHAALDTLMTRDRRAE
jgi:glycerol-3-phosphate dehydrogenase (NAD(P)+)